jgi:hypothetical protein
VNNKHTRVYPLHRGNSPTSNGLILSKNRCYKGWTECSNDLRVEESMNLVSLCLKDRCPFIGISRVPKL